MNAVKNKLSLCVQWARARLGLTAKPTAQDPPRQSPSPVKRVQSPTLSRRTLLSSLPLMAVPWSVARALEAVLPFGESWRFGWIFPRESHQAKVYYGIDLGAPSHSVIYVERNGLLTSVTMAELKENHFEEAAAEINISQGHAGLKLTGGLGTGEPMELEPGEVLLEGTSDRDIEMAVQRAAHGRDATVAEMDQAEKPLYRFVTGSSSPPYGIVIDAMVDEETYGKLDNIVAEEWPLTDDQVARMKALV